MKNTLFTLLLFVLTVSVNAQTIFGKWESKDEETGKVDSIVEIYEKDGKAYAKVIEILDKSIENPTCQNCKGENEDKPILGLDILTGLKKKKKEWSGGKILDPRNGKVYKCYIKLVKGDRLKIRGYIGFSLLGKTIYWERSKN